MKRLLLSALIILLLLNIINSQTWIEQTSGVGTALYSVSAADDHNVWVCGDAGKVLRTVNGGTNWVSVGATPIPSTLPLYCIFGIDSLTVLVTGSTTTATFLYRTSNGGANWVQVFTQTGGFIDAVSMGNASAGFFVGDPVGGRWTLFGTVTGGLTWDSAQFRLPQAGTETGYNNSFFFDPVSQAVWFGTNNTRVYRSTNLILWGTEPTTGEINSDAMYFTSSTNGMCGGTLVLFTTNAGAVWTPVATSMPGTAAVLGITGITSNWWVIRQAAQVYFTYNNGTNWSTSYSAPAGNFLHLTQSRAGIPILYAIRDNGGISKGTNLLVGVQHSSGDVPKEYSLSQNYPNPFNPTTNIKYQIAKNSFVTLKVFDILGREVATLVNGQLKAGSYESHFDGNNFASGTYFYKLKAGDFTETRMLVLLK